jgi:hypothetical protein
MESMYTSDLTHHIVASMPVPVAGITAEQAARAIVDGVMDAATARFTNRFGYAPEVTQRSADRAVILRYIRVLTDTARIGYDGSAKHPLSAEGRVGFTLACINVTAHSEWPEVLNEYADRLP